MSNIDKIMKYENGDLTVNEVIDLFGELLESKLAWKLQGSYGRMARQLIDHGFLDSEGNVLSYPTNNEEY